LLTAAHCVAEHDGAGDVARPVVAVEPSQLRATSAADIFELGFTNRYRNSDYPATSVVIDPNYDGFVGNADDLALLRIENTPPSLPELPLITAAADDIVAGSSVELVGFGETEQGSYGQRRRVLQTVAWAREQQLGIDQTDGRGVCSGDSGGPMLVTRSGSTMIAAVNSFVGGTLAEHCGSGGVGIRVAPHRTFITEGIASLADGGPPGSDASCSFSQARARSTDAPVATLNFLFVVLFLMRTTRTRRSLVTGEPQANHGRWAEM
jgi:hypothetical protein